ncbi:MAG: ExeM/NucH family extracellular endonuclease, partial [Pseudomonadota bacterium]
TRGDVGLSDGDFVGVTDFTGTVGAFTDGVQGYQISDPDGLYRLNFDTVDLTAVGAVTVSIDYFLQSTGWEANDLLAIYVVTDQGTETLIDTSGLDIDDLGIEGAWTTLTVDLGADVNSAQLVVELDANSASEALYVDNVMIADTAPADSAILSVSADVEAQAEGDSGTTSFTFTVTRSGVTTGETTVDYIVGGDVDADDFGGTLPAGTVAFADGETEQTITIDIAGDLVTEPDEALTVTLQNPSTGAVIDTGTATGTVLNDDVATATIAEIQGSSLFSALEGQTVQTTGIITYVEPDGFYMQMGTGDGDTGTSDAIFVFVGNNVLQNPDGSLNDGGGLVVVGNDVTVTGDVSEFGDLTQLETSLAAVTVNATGNELPDAVTVTVSATTDAETDFEATEGMRVEVISGDPTENLTVITNFNLDRFGEIVVSAGTQVQPTQIFDAQTEQAEIDALLNANANNRLIIDDGDFGSNPDVINFVPNISAGDDGDGLLGAQDDFDLGGTLRIGTEITAPVQGIMTEGFGDYRVLATDPIQIDDSTNDGARPDTPDDVLGNAGGGKLDGQLIVTSFNVLNYFTTLDEGGNQTGPDGDLNPRGATSAGDLVRQTDKIVNAILTSGSDVLALQELENNGFGSASAVAALVAALNAADAGADWQFVDPTDPSDPGENGFVGTDAIMTGIIFNANEVTLVYSDYLEFEESSAADTFAIAEVLNAYVPAGDQLGDFQRNRPGTVATFEENDTGEKFTIASVHNKSKGDSGLQDLADGIQSALDNGTIPAGDVAAVEAALASLLADPNFDQGDGQGFWNAVRNDASVELTTWLEGTYLPEAVAAGDLDGITVSDKTLIMGDFNAYAEEDPTQTVRDFDGDDVGNDPDYVDVIDTFVPGGQDESYSFVFDGQQGTLDQAFATDALADLITGSTEWHINADEPDLLNYDSEFNNPGFYSDNVFAASDHDPLLIGLDFNTPIDIA